MLGKKMREGLEEVTRVPTGFLYISCGELQEVEYFQSNMNKMHHKGRFSNKCTFLQQLDNMVRFNLEQWIQW